MSPASWAAPTEDATMDMAGVGTADTSETFWWWMGTRLAALKASPSQGIMTQCIDRSKILNKK